MKKLSLPEARAQEDRLRRQGLAPIQQQTRYKRWLDAAGMMPAVGPRVHGMKQEIEMCLWTTPTIAAIVRSNLPEHAREALVLMFGQAWLLDAVVRLLYETPVSDLQAWAVALGLGVKNPVAAAPHPVPKSAGIAADLAGMLAADGAR